MSSGDSSSESVRAAGQPTEEKAERRKVSHRSLRRETVQVQGPGEGNARLLRRASLGRFSQRGGREEVPQDWGQTQPSSGLLILRGSIFGPLLICHLLQAGLQPPHVLQQFLGSEEEEGAKACRTPTPLAAGLSLLPMTL